MPETLTGPAGVIPVDPDEQRFAAAMAAPEGGAAAKPDYPSPKRRDPEAPHGREADGTPKAPHGVKADGTPRVSPPGPGRGKTGARDGARVQSAGAGKPAAAPAAARGQAEDPEAARARRAADATTTLELVSAAGTLWSMFGLAKSSAAFTEAEARGDKPAAARFSKVYERAQVLQLDAAACALHAEGVGASAAAAAGTNAMAAALVDRLALFNGVASVGMAVLPLVYQLVANHAPKRDEFPPELMALGVLPPNLLLEKLQAQNAVKMARAQAEILAERKEAEAELEQLREHAA